MSEFPKTLKTWRHLRRLSQLDLATEAQVSARHISFLETGRAQPSRDMVGKLSDTLQLPLAIRNQLLNQAGFTSRYPSRNWNDEEMAPIRAAITHMLTSHAPFPGFAIDRHWTILKLNKPAEMLFSKLRITEGTNFIDLMMSDHLQWFIENWPEVAYHAALRLRVESAAQGGVRKFDCAADKLAKVPFDEAYSVKPVIPTIYCIGAVQLSLFATIAQFGTPEDLALDDLKIELFFPANAETEHYLRAVRSLEDR